MPSEFGQSCSLTRARARKPAAVTSRLCQFCRRPPDIVKALAHPFQMRTKRKNANAEYEPLAQHRAAQVNSLLRVDRADQRPVETVELPEICPLTGEAKGNDRELRFGHDFDPGDGAEALGCPERQVQFFIQVAAEGPDPVHLDGEPHPEAFAPATPVRIDIPSIAVSAPVDPVGLNPDGSLQAPKDFDRAGYYTG